MPEAKASNGLPKITALSSYTESINLLAYADPGAGKTVMAGTASKGLLIAIDKGAISASRSGSTAEMVIPANWKEMAAILNAIKNKRDGFGEHPWIMVDSLTELQMMILDGILSDPADGKHRDIDTPQIQDYGKWQHMFKRVVRMLNDLPCHTFYTAHAMRTEDEEGESIVLPDINGKNGSNDPTTMSRWVCGSVHSYGYLKVKPAVENKPEFRRFICKRQGAYFGKDRYGVLTPYVDNPNLDKIAELITNSNPK